MIKRNFFKLKTHIHEHDANIELELTSCGLHEAMVEDMLYDSTAGAIFNMLNS